MLSPQFMILALAISLVGGSKYLISTWRGKTRPNRVTWLMWSLAPMVAFAAQLHEGVGIQSLLTFNAGFMPAVIFLASFKNPAAYWKIDGFDIACGILSLCGIVAWVITRHAVIAILFSIIADAAAGVPTLRKAWSHPESEHPTAFIYGIVAFGLSLLTIDRLTFTNAAFAVYIVLMNSTLVWLIRREPAQRVTA